MRLGNDISLNKRSFINKLLFWLLKLTVIFFLGSMLYAQWGNLDSSFILTGLVLLGVVAIDLNHVNDPHQPIEENARWKIAVNSLLANAAGAMLTFWMSQYLGIGPVLSSAIVGLLGSLLLPKLGTEIYTGSFVGMCAKAIAPQDSLILLAGINAGLIFYFSRSTLVGFGGKLGTIAFASVVLATLALGQKLPSFTPQTSDFSWMIILSSALAAGLTWLLADLKPLGAVRASSIVGLIGGLFFPLFLPLTGSIHAAAVFCASFVGMASRERKPKLWMVVIAGVIAGALIQFSAPVFGGFGGKLGTIAMSSVLSVWGYRSVFDKLRSTNSN
jgi:hypothetical protein